MKVLVFLVLVGTASCAGAGFQPLTTERKGMDMVYVGMYTVEFEVSCDSCRVEYGRDGSTYRDVVEGGWTGSVPLGTLRDGDRVRVVLRVTPVGEARVVAAMVQMNGRTVASGKSDEEGEQVTVRARVGPG